MGRIRERNERLGICICRLFVCFLLDRFIGLYIDIRVSHSCCSNLSITSGAHGIGTGKKNHNHTRGTYFYFVIF